MTVVLGLLGPAGAGKSTAAAYLADKYGAKLYAFAKPLKEIIRRAFSLDEAQVYGSQADKERTDPRYGVSARWLMQRIGTEGVREVLGRTFWVEHCLATIARDAPPLAVIEDVRMLTEVAGINGWRDGFGRFGAVVRLHPVGESVSIDPGTHPSETEWREARVDFEIAPVTRSVPLLCSLIDGVADALGLRPTAPLAY